MICWWGRCLWWAPIPTIPNSAWAAPLPPSGSAIEVHYVVCTDGSKGTKDRSLAPRDLVATREREQRAAADLLGVKSVTFLRQIDGELQATIACRTDLAREIRRVRPRVMITHDPWRLYQLHPDHRAAGFLSTDAFVAARDHLYSPELFLEEALEPYDVPGISVLRTPPK